MLGVLAGCSHSAPDGKGEGPVTPSGIVAAGDDALVRLPRPEQFPTIEATRYRAEPTLDVTGQVQPDVSREIPVISVANGRVVAVHVRLGDYVRKGQLVFEVQSSDVSNAYNQYLKAVNDERLARTVLDRNKLLYSKGAIAQSQLDISQASEADAQSDLRASEAQLHFLGIDKDHPGATVKVYAPASGFIIQQNVTQASSTGTGIAGTPNAFVIADLSHVWVVCSVYESDLSQVRVGQRADIHLTAYPGKLLTGRIDEIGAALDPNLRTAQVRIQVPNPNELLRIGMFATATFHSLSDQTYAVVPATAILHLHDQDWVYVPADAKGDFRRVSVHMGAGMPGNMQQITQGIQPGQDVVRNALALQTTATQ